jgi:hypothetical protein
MPGSGALSGIRKRFRRLIGRHRQQPSAAVGIDAIPRRSAGASLILRDLFDTQGTDKGWYSDFYEVLLRDRREELRNLLEIGIGTLAPGENATMFGYAADCYRPGGSLRAWRDYFPNAEIVGLDCQPDTQFSELRIRTLLCDTTDAASAAAALATLPQFDVIIDDGSHAAQDQLATLRNFYPALRPSGLYFIEDIGQDSPLYARPALIEPFINGAPYFAISDSDGTNKWKMLVIRRCD